MDSNKQIFLSIGKEALGVALEKEMISIEELAKAKLEYDAFLFELEKDFSPQRVKGIILEKVNRALVLYEKKKERIEYENAEARKKGVSFKNRVVFTQRLNKFEEYKKSLVEKRKLLQTKEVKVSDFVTPMDVSLIKNVTFERFLEMFY